MKLPIGDKLKALRSAQHITQEKLAEALNVSCQSVSRWELRICYPDIELLPAIANYFSVTLDDLMGMEQIRSAARYARIFALVQDHERREDWDSACSVLRDAIKTYPADDGLFTELALVLTNMGGTAELAEAIELSERVLSRSTSDKLKSTVRANLCFLYKAAGLHEKAAALGRTLPHIWECREVLLPDLVADELRSTTLERSLDIAEQVLQDVAAHKKISFSLGYRARTDSAENRQG